MLSLHLCKRHYNIATWVLISNLEFNFAVSGSGSFALATRGSYSDGGCHYGD